MKKIIVTESQLSKVRRQLLEAKLRSYVFDWDDNILRMPTKVKMEKKEGEKWVPVAVSTEEFAHFRTMPDKYRTVSDSFIDFRLNEPFLKDAEKAIHNGSFAPSYKKFIEALTYANQFAINTARGHSPETIKKGVKLFINMVLSPEEKKMMIQNILKELPGNLTKGLNQQQLVDLYLDERGEYYPVSSEEFGKEFGLDVTGSAASPEHAKKVAIEAFVKKLIKATKEHIVKGKYKKISLGFSDDDIKNVKAVQKFIDEELKKLYPEVHFVVYDTSAGGKKKMVIEKD